MKNINTNLKEKLISNKHHKFNVFTLNNNQKKIQNKD